MVCLLMDAMSMWSSPDGSVEGSPAGGRTPAGDGSSAGGRTPADEGSNLGERTPAGDGSPATPAGDGSPAGERTPTGDASPADDGMDNGDGWLSGPGRRGVDGDSLKRALVGDPVLRDVSYAEILQRNPPVLVAILETTRFDPWRRWEF